MSLTEVFSNQTYYLRGKPYMVLFIGHMHRTGEPLVHYVPLYVLPEWRLARGDRDALRVHTRTFDDFFENFTDVPSRTQARPDINEGTGHDNEH